MRTAPMVGLSSLSVLVALTVLVGCGSDGEALDAGDPVGDTGPADTSPLDVDMGPADADMGPTDADMGPTDADMGPTDADMGPADVDMGPTDMDMGPADMGPADLGPADMGPTDMGPADLGPADMGPTDMGPADLGPADMGPADMGPADLGPADMGPADMGPADMGPADTGPADMGLADMGPADAGRRQLFPFGPGRGLVPAPRVRTDVLTQVDVGPESTYSPLSSLDDVFAGDDATLRARFRSDFAADRVPRAHPACVSPAARNLDLQTYLKPYLVRQEAYLAWLAANHPARTDFLPARARASIDDFRGDPRCPLFDPAETAGPAEVVRTFGQVLRASSDEVELHLDNRRNPMRWIAPINVVHHHEQPSLAYEVDPSPEDAAESERVMEAYLAGDRSRRVLLEYDIDLEVVDHSTELGELNVWGLYDGVHPSAATDIVGRTHWNTYLYAELGLAPPGRGPLSAIEQRLYQTYFGARFLDPSFQMSVAIIFRADGTVWRDGELMLASHRYASSHAYPVSPGGQGFLPTGNDVMNAPDVTPEGGTSGPVGWHRMRIDAISSFAATVPEEDPILDGGEYLAMPTADVSRRLHGVVDLTRYYVLARAHRFFPGQRGYWVGCWQGFEGDPCAVPAPNPGEAHGVYGAFVIFEAHGALETRVRIHRFDAWIE